MHLRPPSGRPAGGRRARTRSRRCSGPLRHPPVGPVVDHLVNYSGAGGRTRADTVPDSAALDAWPIPAPHHHGCVAGHGAGFVRPPGSVVCSSTQAALIWSWVRYLVFVRSVPPRVAPVRSAPVRSAPGSLASRRVAPQRLAPGRIGRINGIFAPLPRPRAPQRPRQRPRFTAGPCVPPSAPRRPHRSAPEPGGARRCTALRGFGWCWTGASGWIGERLRGALGRRPREGRLGKAGGKISNGISKALQA
jgi:hypothetical protein